MMNIEITINEIYEKNVSEEQRIKMLHNFLDLDYQLSYNQDPKLININENVSIDIVKKYD